MVTGNTLINYWRKRCSQTFCYLIFLISNKHTQERERRKGLAKDPRRCPGEKQHRKTTQPAWHSCLRPRDWCISACMTAEIVLLSPHPPPPSLLTDIHRWIGYRNPTYHRLGRLCCRYLNMQIIPPLKSLDGMISTKKNLLNPPMRKYTGRYSIPSIYSSKETCIAYPPTSTLHSLPKKTQTPIIIYFIPDADGRATGPSLVFISCQQRSILSLKPLSILVWFALVCSRQHPYIQQLLRRRARPSERCKYVSALYEGMHHPCVCVCTFVCVCASATYVSLILYYVYMCLYIVYRMC